jgi:hypothetical protein
MVFELRHLSRMSQTPSMTRRWQLIKSGMAGTTFAGMSAIAGGHRGGSRARLSDVRVVRRASAIQNSGLCLRFSRAQAF